VAVRDPVARQHALEALAGGGVPVALDACAPHGAHVIDDALPGSVEVAGLNQRTVLEAPWRRAALLDALHRVSDVRAPRAPVFADEVVAVDADLLDAWVTSRRAALAHAQAELTAAGHEGLPAVRAVAHQTRGSGGAYGVHAATQLAKALEEACREASRAAEPSPAAIDRVAQSLDALRALVERVRWVEPARPR
jgi:HPt (histidine-containing phosphotransfer) domain-containing protein